MLTKDKILFVLPLPPPTHGASMVGEFIKNSKIINDSFNTIYINSSTSKTVGDIGKSPLKKIYRYFSILFSVFKYLKSFNPNVLYLSITAKGIGFYKDIPIVLFAKFFRKKIILHFHNKGVSDAQNKFIDNFLYKFIFKNTSVILLSKMLYYDISNYVKEKNVFYCPNGIPSLDSDEQIESNEGVPNLLFLSNLIESKGVYVLLDALKKLKLNGIKFHLNIVGGEGDISASQLEKKINSLDLNDCVSYLGKKYGKDKANILKASYAFVFPTFYHNECFPLVLLEAMQFGLPIISTDEGGILDIVCNYENGLIVEKKNIDSLAQKITWLIENPEKVKVINANNHNKFINNYKLNVFEKNLKNIFNKIS